MADETNLETGDNAEDVIAGKKNQQQRTEQRSDPRQSVRAGDTFISGSSDSSIQMIWYRIIEHGQQIRDLISEMDDLPEKVRELKNQIEAQKNTLEKLKELEVIVRKEEVVIRTQLPPVPKPPESLNISIRTLFVTLVIIGIFIALAVGFLVWRTL